MYHYLLLKYLQPIKKKKEPLLAPILLVTSLQPLNCSTLTANVGATSSVSSLEEDEGIVNEDEYERAVHRIEKINKKITTLIKNWNEESKLAKTSSEVVEIDEFYRTYMDQYNARQKALERLMEIYEEYYKDTTPMRASPQKHSTDGVIPQPVPRTGRTTIKEKVEGNKIDRKKQLTKEEIPNETRLKHGVDEDTSTSTSDDVQPMTTMNTITLTVINLLTSISSFPRTTTEIVGTMGTPFQGRLSTLSSVVRPTPMTATRTIAITREESRQDALETARQMMRSTSFTVFRHMPTNISTSQELFHNEEEEMDQARVEPRTRISSPPIVSRMTATTTPIGTATPIAQDLIWPGHPDIQETNLFPRVDDPSTVAAGGLDPKERWKIHHPYDIPRVRRPTMDTPDNLRRLAESEALVESLQTMECLTEFPTLEERRDFR